MPQRKTKQSKKKPAPRRVRNVRLSWSGVLIAEVRFGALRGARTIAGPLADRIVRELNNNGEGVLRFCDKPPAPHDHYGHYLAVGRNSGVVLVWAEHGDSGEIAVIPMCPVFCKALGLDMGQVRFCTVEAA